jgi:SAM-dependent methyltransferase
MDGSTSILRRPGGVAMVALMGVAAGWLMAIGVEALTSRDWTLRGWEWPQVAAFTALLVVGAMWALSPRMRLVRMRRPASVEPRRLGRETPVRTQVRSESAARRLLGSAGLPERPVSTVRGRQSFTARRVAGGVYRRVPRAPFRYVMPTLVWRGAFRFWLSVLAADPDTRRGVKDLLVSYDDAYHAVDRAAIRYDGGIHVKHRLTHYHDFFVERVKAGERVLDIGSGKGELAFDLVTISGAAVVGVDHDPGHLDFARQRFTHPDLGFFEGDVLEWLPDGHFDVVVLSNVLEHLDGRVEFLRRVVSSTAPDRFLFRVPVFERDWTVPLRDEVGLLAYWDPDHAIEYSADTFVAELADAALEVDELVVRWGEIWASARPQMSR